MHCSGNKPSSVLLVQGTGSGKSTVPQTVSVVTCGITLVIENTLSLGADQCSKFEKAVQNHGPVQEFQLDALKTEDEINALKDLILTLPSDTNSSIFLYSLPERILNLMWSSVFADIIKRVF